MIKLYCVFAKESVLKMNGNRGKLASQAGHAYLHSVWDAMRRFPQSVADYQASERAYKIALVVDTVAELQKLQDAYVNTCGVSLVRDAAFTVFDEPTVTCLGIGPIHEDQIGMDLAQLKLLI